MGLFECGIFQFVRNFAHNFQATLRNKVASKFSKIACCTVAFDTLSIYRRGTVEFHGCII